MQRRAAIMSSVPSPDRTSRWRWLCGCLSAIVRQRCPRCWKGRMFRGGLSMNDPCPECGLIFQREEGYFLGAMYVSYGISSIPSVLLFNGGEQPVERSVGVRPEADFVKMINRVLESR